MTRLANPLAVCGAAVAIIVVLTAWLIGRYGSGEFDWQHIKAQTTAVLVLTAVVILAALMMKRSAQNGRPRLSARNVIVCSVGFFALILSVTIVTKRILRMPKAFSQVPITTATKYKFTEDWVSSSADNWARYLSPLRGKADVHALEIGSYEGRSALWFLENILTQPSSTITCVDIFSSSYDYERVYDDNIQISGYHNRVKKIKADSAIALRTLPFRNYDFVYIDGSHIAKDVLSDAVLVWDLVKPGGIIIFDDYRWHGMLGQSNGPAHLPRIAIDAFLSVYQPYIEVLHKEYQVILRKREKVDLDSQNFGVIERALDFLLH